MSHGVSILGRCEHLFRVVQLVIESGYKELADDKIVKQPHRLAAGLVLCLDRT